VSKILEHGDRLLDKSQICKIANVTYPTIWAWLAALPVRKLKGDGPPEAA